MRASRIERSAAVVVGSMLVLTAAGCGLFDVFIDQVKADIKDNPVIVQHIGTIQSMEIDWAGTGSEPDENTFVFNVTGSKGSGVLTAECITIDANTEDVRSGKLETSAGQTFDLFARGRAGGSQKYR